MRILFAGILLFLTIHLAYSQGLLELKFHEQTISGFVGKQGVIQKETPMFSFVANGRKYYSNEVSPFKLITHFENQPEGVKAVIEFVNTSKDTLVLENVVPFGERSDVYITGLGKHRLSRTHLFLPGRKPVNVIVPDNAWELGYAGVALNDSLNVCGLVRRDKASLKSAKAKRFETIVHPGGSVRYFFYADFYKGSWQEGLRLMFQKRFLYDVEKFDASLFERKDLQWMRESYVIHLLMAWDKDYYDAATGKFTLPDFIRRGKNLYGGDEVVCIWPTWPTLGIDQRNQFDLYKDLPGGLALAIHDHSASHFVGRILEFLA